MSLDVSLISSTQTGVFTKNITHNLNKMAAAAGIYELLWRPDETNIKTANQLIAPLTLGLKLLKDNPKLFEAFNPKNGWGNYDGLVSFVEEYLTACKEDPDATIMISR